MLPSSIRHPGELDEATLPAICPILSKVDGLLKTLGKQRQSNPSAGGCFSQPDQGD